MYAMTFLLFCWGGGGGGGGGGIAKPLVSVCKVNYVANIADQDHAAPFSIVVLIRLIVKSKKIFELTRFN